MWNEEFMEGFREPMPSHRNWYGYPYRGPATHLPSPEHDYTILVRDANAAMFNIVWDFFWPVLCRPTNGFALEIAAGHGWASYLLSSHRRVIAVDTDYGVLSGICCEVGKGITPIIGDGRYLPLTGESLDLIFMNSGYHHIQDRAGAWDEWYRVLKSGGRLAATGETPMETEEILRQRLEAQWAEGAPPDEGGYTKLELASLLEKAGSKFTFVRYIRMQYQENMRYMASEELVVGDEEGSNGIILAVK